MIDSSRAPMPVWKRYGTMVLLVVLIVVAAWMLWTKELKHHSGGGSSSTSAPGATVGTRSAIARRTVSTTIPGGLRPSSRNPFAG